MLSSGRHAMIVLGVDDKDLQRGLASARKRLSGFWQFANKPIAGRKGLGEFGKGLVHGLASGIASNVMGRVTDFVAETATGIIDTERSMTRLKIAGRMSGAEMDSFRDKLRGVSLATGVSRDKLIEGTHSYIAITGDAAGAAKAMELFGRVSAASGAEMSDITRTAAALRMNMKIDPKDFERAFDILISQGKAGSIEINDLAGIMADVAPSFSNFAGGGGVEGLNQMSAILQTVGSGFGSAAEAGTALKGTYTALVRHADKFADAGVQIYKPGTNQVRNIMDIFRDLDKKHLSGTVITKLFGRVEPQQLYDLLMRRQGDFNRLIAEGGGHAVAKDSLEYLNTSAGKIDLAVNSIKEAIIAAFTPERIAAFANVLGKVAEYMGELVGYIDHVMGNKTKKEIREEKDLGRVDDMAKRRRAVMIERYAGRFGKGAAGVEGLTTILNLLAQGGQGARIAEQALRAHGIGKAERGAVEGTVHMEDLIERGITGSSTKLGLNGPELFGASGFSIKQLAGLAKNWAPTTSDPKYFAALIGKEIAARMPEALDKIDRGLYAAGEELAKPATKAKSRRGNHKGVIR